MTTRTIRYQMMYRVAVLFGMLSMVGLSVMPPQAQAQFIDDVYARYALVRIPDIVLNGNLMPEEFQRHNIEVAAGKGPFTLGVLYQHVTHVTNNDASQDGVTLTASYGRILSDYFRLDLIGNLALSNTNEAMPTYADDTDIAANLVWFTPYGFGSNPLRSFFPSAYVGAKYNYFGRLQVVGGAGLWWNKIGLYLTGYHAVNGLDNPMIAPDNPDFNRRWAYLQNQGLNVSLSYELGPIEVRMYRNFGLVNAGNDQAFEIRYRHFFAKPLK